MRINDTPVIVLYGTLPQWRGLQPGIEPGNDVKQLAENLNSLHMVSGGKPLPLDGVYSSRVAASVARFLISVGLKSSHALDLGRVIYVPAAVIVGPALVSVGSSVSMGTEVLPLASTARVALATAVGSDGSRITTGEAAQITTANSLAPISATVLRVIPQASAASAQATTGGAGPPPAQAGGTLVTLSLDDGATLPSPDVPVTVEITVAVVKQVLLIPTSALIGVDSGYAIELSDGRGNVRRLGITVIGYDDVGQQTAVRAAGLQAGDMVVVPATTLSPGS